MDLDFDNYVIQGLSSRKKSNNIPRKTATYSNLGTQNLDFLNLDDGVKILKSVTILKRRATMQVHKKKLIDRKKIEKQNKGVKINSKVSRENTPTTASEQNYS